MRGCIEVARSEGSDRAAVQAAVRRIADVDDPAAVPALIQALAYPPIRTAVVRALGRTAGPSEVPAVAACLQDAESAVRSAGRGALAEVGGSAAADALADSLAFLDDAERGEAQAALAWIGDSRDLAATRELAHRRLIAPYGEGIRLAHRGWGSVYALVRVGDDADRQALADALVALIPDAIVNDPEKWWISLAEPAKTAVEMVCKQLLEAGFAEMAGDTQARVDQLLQERRSVVSPYADQPRRVGVRLDPELPRSTPKLELQPLDDELVPDDEWSMALFGGQPRWVGPPTWPLDAHGAPMRFYGQLPLLQSPERIAYLFLSDNEAATWEPLSGANALILQPGPPPNQNHLPRPTGPQLFDAVHHRDRYVPYSQSTAVRRRFTLARGADPLSWSWPEHPENTYLETPSSDWNKIGGTPMYLQGEDVPPGDGWQFAFQFTAAWTGGEIADGAECYGFAREDGQGAFLWQCH